MNYGELSTWDQIKKILVLFSFLFSLWSKLLPSISNHPSLSNTTHVVTIAKTFIIVKGIVVLVIEEEPLLLSVSGIKIGQPTLGF